MFHALDCSSSALCLQAAWAHHCRVYAHPHTDETGFHEFCIFNSERLNKHTKWLIKSNCHMRLNTVALNELVLLWVYPEREHYEYDSAKAKSSLWKNLSCASNLHTNLMRHILRTVYLHTHDRIIIVSSRGNQSDCTFRFFGYFRWLMKHK